MGDVTVPIQYSILVFGGFKIPKQFHVTTPRFGHTFYTKCSGMKVKVNTQVLVFLNQSGLFHCIHVSVHKSANFKPYWVLFPQLLSVRTIAYTQNGTFKYSFGVFVWSASPLDYQCSKYSNLGVCRIIF